MRDFVYLPKYNFPDSGLDALRKKEFLKGVSLNFPFLCPSLDKENEIWDSIGNEFLDSKDKTKNFHQDFHNFIYNKIINGEINFYLAIPYLWNFLNKKLPTLSQIDLYLVKVNSISYLYKGISGLSKILHVPLCTQELDPFFWPNLVYFLHQSGASRINLYNMQESITKVKYPTYEEIDFNSNRSMKKKGFYSEYFSRKNENNFDLDSNEILSIILNLPHNQQEKVKKFLEIV